MLQVLPLQILEYRIATRLICYIVLVFCCFVWFFLIEELPSWINSLGKFIPLFVPPQGLVQILQKCLRNKSCFSMRGFFFSFFWRMCFWGWGNSFCNLYNLSFLLEDSGSSQCQWLWFFWPQWTSCPAVFQEHFRLFRWLEQSIFSLMLQVGNLRYEDLKCWRLHGWGGTWLSRGQICGPVSDPKRHGRVKTPNPRPG